MVLGWVTKAGGLCWGIYVSDLVLLRVSREAMVRVGVLFYGLDTVTAEARPSQCQKVPSILLVGWGVDQLQPARNKQTNKNLRCGNRKGLLGRNDQTHHRMGPKTMESIPPSKRNTQADIQLRTRQTNHQQETDGCIQIKHNPEHQPSRMSSKSTAYVPPKTASTPTKANTQTCSYLDFNQFLIRRITRNICLRLRIKQIQILTCREQDIR